MEMYTDERISKEHFSNGKLIEDLIKQTEDLYTEHFGKSGPGDAICKLIDLFRTWRFKESS
jgi:hypothetical protein